MTGWTVMLHGIRFRARRSALVLAIAAIATAAAVSAVAYARAAEASVLADGLRAAPAYQTEVVVGATGSDGAGTPGIDATHLAVNHAFQVDPALARHFAAPVAAADTDALLTGADTPAMALFAYRAGVCAQVTIDGACPSEPGQAMLSKRSADALGVHVGDRLTAHFGAQPQSATAGKLAVTVVGLYTPRDPTAAYWNANPYFDDGTDPSGVVSRRLDAAFTYSEADVRTDATATVNTRLEVPLRPGSVTVDDDAALRSGLARFVTSAKGAGLTVNTSLPDVLSGIATQQRDLARTIPVVAVPLGLLSLFVLVLVVASLSEERSPELALAKLRGFASGRATAFGAAEMVALIVLAAPVGLVLGLIGTQVAARVLLASGTDVQLRWPVLVTTVAAAAIGSAAATIAVRRNVRRGVLGLLRRVPERGGWRAGVTEAVVLAVVAASLVGALLDRRSVIAWLAAPSLALIAGVAAARAMAATAGARLRSASRRGRISGLLAGARVARQSGRHRVIAVITVAVALLTFAATLWDAGATARRDSATDSLGADRVYTVVAPYPSALVAAVQAADPSGDAMAVVRTHQYYGDGDVQLVGVETAHLSRVARWRGESAAALTALSAVLRPPSAPQLTVHGRMTVTAQVASADRDAVSLGALVSTPGSPPREIGLGTLDPARSTYAANLTGCDSGCRFLGLTVGRVASGAGTLHASFRIGAIHADGADLSTFTSVSTWKMATDRAPGATVTLVPGQALGVQLSSTDQNPALIEYQDAPAALPVVAAGGSPASNRAATTFNFPGLGSDPQAMAVAARTARLPRVGTDGLLFDLDSAVAIAGRAGTLADQTNLQYEVWADGDAPSDLANRLAAHGVTVLHSDSISAYLDRVGRGAPTLALWFYLFAGALSLLLAAGAAMLGAYVGAETRMYEYAALKVVGVPPAQLRRALLQEYRTTLGVALVVGVAAGVGGALLMLPGIALVQAGGPAGAVEYGTRPLALPLAVLVTLLALTGVAAAALRLIRGATPDRLREADAR